MSDLDWSKAPRGAYKIVENPSNCNLYWAGDKGVLILGNWVLDRGGYHTIATRPAESEVERQEGEQWTHTAYGDQVKIANPEPDAIGNIVVMNKNGRYGLAEKGYVLERKPKITQDQADSIIAAAAAWGVDADDCQDYLLNFSVTGHDESLEF